MLSDKCSAVRTVFTSLSIKSHTMEMNHHDSTTALHLNPLRDADYSKLNLFPKEGKIKSNYNSVDGT